MGGEEDRQAARLVQFAKEAVKPLLGSGVHPGDGLVEDEEVRLGGEGSGDEDPLQLASRQVPHPNTRLGLHPHGVQRPVHGLMVLRRQESKQPTGRDATQGDDLLDGGRKPGVNVGGVLRNVPDPLPGPERLDGLSEDEGLAPLGMEEAEDHLDQRRLPRPVLSDEGREVPHGDAEGDVLQDQGPLEAYSNVFQFDGVHGLVVALPGLPSGAQM